MISKTYPMNNIRLLFILFILVAQNSWSQGKTENVVLITLDGLRWQELFKGADPVLINDKNYVGDIPQLRQLFWAEDENARREKLMPFFWTTIATEGQLYGNRDHYNKVNVSNGKWFSYPGYNEILTGHADDARIKSNDKLPNPNKTVLEFLNKQKEFNDKVAAFGSWDVFPFIINEERSEIPVNAGFEAATGKKLTKKEVFLNALQTEIPYRWSSVRFDAFTHHYAMEYLRKHKPRVLYIAYGETDDFAHDGKFDSYLKSAHQTDAFIKEIWEYVQSTPRYKNKTTLIITTDHGRGNGEEWKNHASNIQGADQIWMAFLGPDTKPLGEVKSEEQLYQNQVASTLAFLLNRVYTAEKEVGAPIIKAIKAQ